MLQVVRFWAAWLSLRQDLYILAIAYLPRNYNTSIYFSQRLIQTNEPSTVLINDHVYKESLGNCVHSIVQAVKYRRHVIKWRLRDARRNSQYNYKDSSRWYQANSKFGIFSFYFVFILKVLGSDKVRQHTGTTDFVCYGEGDQVLAVI